MHIIKDLFDQVDFSAIRSDKNNQDRGKSTESINLVIAPRLELLGTYVVVAAKISTLLPCVMRPKANENRPVNAAIQPSLAGISLT